MSMPSVAVDMDGVLVKYREAHQRALKKNPEIIYPQMSYGFYANLEPVEDAQWAWTELNSVGFDMHILTTPSVLNPLSYTEKRISVEKLFGLDACYKLNMGCDKSMWIGDYLIDDNTHIRTSNIYSKVN
jgi:5'(3')-deoxyribonucleotidase